MTDNSRDVHILCSSSRIQSPSTYTPRGEEASRVGALEDRLLENMEIKRGDHGLVNPTYGEKMQVQPRIMEDTKAKTDGSRHHLATKMCTQGG